jgi:hypothetical protein
MKKSATDRRAADGLEIPELGAEFFAKAAQGRHYAKVMADSNLVRIASDLRAAFPNEASVNQALRELLRFRETLTQITSDKVKRKKIA